MLGFAKKSTDRLLYILENSGNFYDRFSSGRKLIIVYW